MIHTELHEVVIGGEQMVTSDHILYSVVFHLFSDEIARMAVPLFFFFSGFLFFSHLSPFSFSAYQAKLKKRFYSLVVPYLFWNIVVLLLYVAMQVFIPGLASGANKPVIEYTFTDYLHAFWDRAEGKPVCYQFWFLRDLIVTVIISPLVFLLIRYLKTAGILILGIMWISGFPAMPAGLSSVALFFFALGGWYRISGHDFATDTMNIRKWTGGLYLLVLIINTFLWFRESAIHSCMHKCGILIGMAAVVGWVTYGLERNRLHTNAVLSGSSFFIYAYHGMWIALLCKMWVKFLPVTTGTLLLGYVLLPMIILAIGIGAYVLLHCRFPRLISVVTGGR